MATVRLYVRSDRTTLITARVSMEAIGALHTTSDYFEGSTRLRYSPDEEYAREVLKRSGVDFETMNLSKSFKARVHGWIKHITETPALVDLNHSGRRFVGMKEIQKFLADKKN